MPHFVEKDILVRAVHEKTGVPKEEVEKVLAAFDEAALTLLNLEGAKVRLLGGYLTAIRKRQKRLRHPKTREMVEVPEKRKIVFKETRK